MAEKKFYCPKCKHEQPPARICKYCGFNIYGYIQEMKRRRAEREAGQAPGAGSPGPEDSSASGDSSASRRPKGYGGPQRAVPPPSSSSLGRPSGSEERHREAHSGTPPASSARGSGGGQVGYAGVPPRPEGFSPEDFLSDTDGALSPLGDLLTTAWQIFRNQWVALIVIPFLSAFVGILAGLLVGGILYSPAIAFPELKAAFIVLGIMAGSLILIIAITWGYAAINHAVVHPETGTGEAMTRGFGHLWAYLWVYGLLALILGGAFVFFLVPAAIAAVLFAFAPLILADEDKRGMAALMKSRAYVKGLCLPVFGRLMLFYLITIGISFIPFIGNFLTTAALMAMMGALYFDLRRVKEGDPGHMADEGTAKTLWLAIGIIGNVILILGILYAMGPNLNKFWSVMTGETSLENLVEEQPGLPVPPLPPADKETETGEKESGTIELMKTTYQPDEIMTITFTAPSAWPEDAWIGIVPSSVPHGSEAENDSYDLAYEYLNKRTYGQAVFTAPRSPGYYDIRLHDTDTDGREVASVSFTVGDLRPEAAPTSAGGGSTAPPPENMISASARATVDSPDSIGIYIYSLNYEGRVLVNGREVYDIKGDKDMNYNFNGFPEGLSYGENTVEVHYRSLPEPWKREIEIEFSKSDGTEVVSWTIDDPEGVKTYRLILERP